MSYSGLTGVSRSDKAADSFNLDPRDKPEDDIKKGGGGWQRREGKTERRIMKPTLPLPEFSGREKKRGRALRL